MHNPHVAMYINIMFHQETCVIGSEPSPDPQQQLSDSCMTAAFLPPGLSGIIIIIIITIVGSASYAADLLTDGRMERKTTTGQFPSSSCLHRRMWRSFQQLDWVHHPWSEHPSFHLPFSPWCEDSLVRRLINICDVQRCERPGHTLLLRLDRSFSLITPKSQTIRRLFGAAVLILWKAVNCFLSLHIIKNNFHGNCFCSYFTKNVKWMKKAPKLSRIPKTWRSWRSVVKHCHLLVIPRTTEPNKQTCFNLWTWKKVLNRSSCSDLLSVFNSVKMIFFLHGIWVHNYFF